MMEQTEGGVGSPRHEIAPPHSSSGNMDSRTAAKNGEITWEGARDARPILPKAAFFMGDLRDGLPMLNMQAAYLISAKNFSEKQVGVLFFVFGISQFLCMAPSGYFLDYSNHKINWVMFSGVATAALTVMTAITAAQNGENMTLMIVLKVLQGSITAIMPPGFNGITLGIVGSTRFTHQVSRNRMMHHIGTALFVAVGSLIAYFLYPNLGHLFAVAPLAAAGFCYYLCRIQPRHVDRDAARGLILESKTMTEYDEMDDLAEAMWQSSGKQEAMDVGCGSTLSFYRSPTYIAPDLVENETNITTSDDPSLRSDGTFLRSYSIKSQSSKHTIKHSNQKEYKQERTESSDGTSSRVNSFSSMPSFTFGWNSMVKPRARTPLDVLMDRKLILFTFIVFFFHMANGSVLPLVMQSLSLSDPQSGILLSGLCILIAQGFMAGFAKLCGDYSPIWGRKNLVLIGLFALSTRCFVLTGLVQASDNLNNAAELDIVQLLILSTQLLDSVGMGIFGTLHILVTNDISAETGRFSLMLGVTTAAMCLGGTVSSYMGQALAQDYGYPAAFGGLGMLSLLPFFLYLILMPETLPDYAKPKPRSRKRLEEFFQSLRGKRDDFKNSFACQASDSLGEMDRARSPVGHEMDNRPSGTKLVEIV